MSLLLALTGGSNAFTLACATGSYVISGNDAALTYASAGGNVYALACDTGAYSVNGSPAVLAYVSSSQPETFYSGGWTHSQARRRNKRELYQERVRLGILPPAVVKAAKKVVDVIEEAPVYKADQRYMETLMMEEMKVTKWLPDHSRAIQIQLEIRRQNEDDEEVLLLM